MTDTIKYLDEFKKTIKELGVKKGDILYVASDITGFLYRVRSALDVSGKAGRNDFLNSFVDAMQDCVGTEGTLLFPVFSWDFCRGKGFDINKTKGEVGALSNWVMENRKDFLRTRHPMYSFMVWGKHQTELVNMDNQDAWSAQSPFEFLKTHNAMQLMFDIEAYQGITFCHYCEQSADVPYRHPKYFFGEYTDENGNTEVRMYSMGVREEDVAMEVTVKNEFLIANNVAKQQSWEDNLLTVIDLAATYPVLMNDIKNNNGKNSIKLENFVLDWVMERRTPYEVKLHE